MAHGVDGGDAVGGGEDVHVVDGLHEAGCRHEEGGVGNAPRRRDDLAAAWFGVRGGVRARARVRVRGRGRARGVTSYDFTFYFL